MAYITLYRKYRPQTFDEVVGQKHIVATIQSAIENNKISHAYLFCGPRGTGKTTVARLVAKAVNCESQQRPCCKCDNCLAIQAGNHPDIVEIDAASNNGVDEIRELIDKVKYAPLSAKYKIYIIDEVHMLTSNAFNALLKTLEDPPEHVIFILATTEAYKVLPTIVSRCQRFDFAKVDNNSIVDKIKEVSYKEELKYEDGLLEEIAVLAEGGLRDALGILDQLNAFCGDYLDIDSLHKVYGLLAMPEKVALLLSVFKQNTTEILEILDKVNNQGLDIRRLTNELTEILKETIIYNLTKDEKLLIKCDVQQIETISEEADNEGLFALIDLLLDTAEKYRLASNANLYFETCLLKALNLSPIEKGPLIEKKIEKPKPEIEDKIKEIEIKEKIIENKEEEINEDKKDEDSYDYLLSLLLRANKEMKADVNLFWPSIIDYCNDNEYARCATALKQSEVFAAGDDFIIVCSDYDEIVLQINQSQNVLLNAALLYKLSNITRQVFAFNKNESEILINDFKNLKNREVPLEPAKPLDFSSTDKPKEENPLFEIFGKEGVEVVE